MRKLFSLLIMMLVVSCSVAQPGQWNTKDKKAIKYAEEAIAAIRLIEKETGRPDYETGIYWCDKAIERDENFVDAYLMKADFEMQSGKNQEAIATYRKLISLPDFHTASGLAYFDLATLEYSDAQYAEAKTHLQQYVQFQGANPEMKNSAAWLMANCDFAIEAMKNPVPFKPENLGAGVNTLEPEYFPTLTVDQNQLLFTREVGKARNGRGQEDFFVSTNNNGYWEHGEPMPRNINTYANEGAPTFAPDGRTLIFVGCADMSGQYGENRRGYGSCDLFITQKVGENWLDPINLPGAVNTRHWETQPSLSADGKTLYFIRGNMRSSGGRARRNGDIYVSKLQSDGTFGEAVKLPDNINTPYSESSVLIHPDGKTLYFSSNGHIGMGGYDLYMTQLQPDGSWSDPKNLGYPINTAQNENSLLVYANGEIAIFGSDREGGLGDLDLYQFEMPESIRPTRTIYMTGTVYDSTSKKKLRAEFSLVDLATGEEMVRAYSDQINGTFLVSLPVNREYGLFVEKEGYFPYSINFNLTVPENSTDPYHKDVPLLALSEKPVVRLENVFFDLASSKLRPESFVELDKLVQHLNNNPNMKIELQGHTDTRGDAKDNMILSQGRAKSVYEYLISKGIAAERLSHKGFGETQPEISDEEIEKLPTEKEKEAAHQRNRRTVYAVK